MPDISLIDETFSGDLSDNYHLSVQIGLNDISYCILHIPENKYIAIESHIFNKQYNYKLLIEKIKLIYNKSFNLQCKFKSVHILINNEFSTLIPAILYKEINKRSYLGFNYNSTEQDEIFSDYLKVVDSYNIYSIPKNLLKIIKEIFNNPKIKHSSSSLIENSLIENKNDNQKKVILNVNTNSFNIIVVDDKKLILYNTFQFKSKEDFIYYILIVFEQLELNPEVHRIQLLGNIDRSSELYAILYTYIRHISFFKRNPNFNYSYKFDSIPEHSFYNLFNQYLCE